MIGIAFGIGRSATTISISLRDELPKKRTSDYSKEQRKLREIQLRKFKKFKTNKNLLYKK